MKNKDIMLNKLDFLIADWHFFFSYYEKSEEIYRFENRFGKIEFTEWEQFDEHKMIVYVDNEAKEINFLAENPSMYSLYLKKKRGFWGMFCDVKTQYWEMVADTILKSIKTTQTIFGLKIDS